LNLKKNICYSAILALRAAWHVLYILITATEVAAYYQ